MKLREILSRTQLDAQDLTSHKAVALAGFCSALIVGTIAFAAAAPVANAVPGTHAQVAKAGSAAAGIKPCSSDTFSCDSGYAKVAQHSFWNMAQGHNCTNYVAYRMKKAGVTRNFDDLGNAAQWADVARQHKVAVDKVPVVGAVAQWTSGASGLSWAGHVAVVLSVTPKTITIMEDNYSSGPLRVRVIQRGSAQSPSNFIHFADSRTRVEFGKSAALGAAGALETRYVRAALGVAGN